MRFMLLLMGDEATEAGVLPDEGIIAAMGRYNDDMTRAGVLLEAEGLHPTSKGARLRQAAGKLSVTDGPFTEAKEVIAGYWVIEVGSKDAAIEWARRCPLGPDEPTETDDDRVGMIEVRQIFELDDFPVGESESGWREREAGLRAATEEAQATKDGQPATKPTEQPTMRFLMMFMADRDSEAGLLPSEQLLTEMGGLVDEMAQAGVLLSGEGLQASAKGARVTFSKGKRTVIDGPFTETKELVAGYSIIRVRSKDEAIEWARRGVMIDADGRGGESEVQLRQIFELSDFPSELLAQA